MSSEPYESMRARYRPRRIRVLFVGESRPTAGRFFYCRDSGLAKYTGEAFDAHYGPSPDVAAFLERFKALGCFLIDLCPEPVNQLPKKQRRECHRAGENALAAQLRQFKPAAIVVIVKGIAASVTRAIEGAGVDVPRFDLPFPSHGHQRGYVSELRTTISQLVQRGILENAP